MTGEKTKLFEESCKEFDKCIDEAGTDFKRWMIICTEFIKEVGKTYSSPAYHLAGFSYFLHSAMFYHLQKI